LFQDWVDIFWENIPNTRVHICNRYLSLTNSDQSQQNQLFVAFSVNFVSDLRGKREYESELLNRFRVSLKASEYQTFVIEVAHDVHRGSILLEAYCGIVYDLKRMLVTFGLNAKLSEFSVQRTAHWIVILGLLLFRALNLFDSSQNGADPVYRLLVSLEQILSVQRCNKVELLGAVLLLIQVKFN
jgi:hypothetical protein